MPSTYAPPRRDLRKASPARLTPGTVVYSSSGWLSTLAAFFYSIGMSLTLFHVLGMSSSIWLSLCFVASIVVNMSVLPVRVTFGRDGLLVSRFGVRRFVAYSSLRAVTHHERRSLPGWPRLELRTAEGRRVKISLSPHARLIGTFGPRVGDEAVLERFRSDYEAALRAPAVDAPPGLARDSRSFAEWRSALHEIARGDTDYRHPGHSRADMWSIVESVACAPELRAAAAYALGCGELSEDERAKLRELAPVTAAPGLGALFDAVAAGTGVDRALTLLPAGPVTAPSQLRERNDDI